MANKITVQAKIEVQEFEGGYCLFLVVTEQEEHIRKGYTEERLLRCHKLTNPIGNKYAVERQIPYFEQAFQEGAIRQ